MRRLLMVGIAMLMLTVAVGADAATYHVAQSDANASDQNPGSQEKPWKTLAQAAETAQARDTVWIKAGIYQETLAPRNSGTRAKPITF